MLSTDFLTLSPEIVGDPARMADALLTRQMDRRTAEGHDGFIAGPFDVLEITAKGLEWKHCKPQCGQGCPR